MRREGYELSVSKPEVIFKTIDDMKYEPFEKVIINVPTIYQGTIINDLNERKGILELMSNEEENYTNKIMLHFKINILSYNSILNLNNFLLLFSNNEGCNSSPSRKNSRH